MLNKENLHPYQRAAVEHILNNPFAGLLMEMGLGKTVTTLTALEALICDTFEVRRVLVVAPKKVVESVWEEEAANWSHLKHLVFSKVLGTAKQREEALRKDADIYLINRENVVWLCGQYGGALPFDMLVIDELSSFKSAKSQRFKALKLARPRIGRVVGLTGTPAPNGLIDLWAQMYLLDRGERLFKTVGAYREAFFNKGRSNGHIVYEYNLRKGCEERIHERIGDICVSLKAEDYLSLPGRVTNTVKLHFDEKAAEAYRAFERDKVLEMFGEGEEVTAANAAALSNKLLQFANGCVYDDDKNPRDVHAVKLEALRDLVEEANGEPVLVAWAYRSEEARIHKALKAFKPRALKTNKDLEDWNAGKIRVATLHPASGGHGLNLQKGGRILVWFGLTWSLELYQQFNARLDRQGQTKPVMVHHLAASGTIDERVLKALDGKAAGQNGLMEAVKESINKYLNNF